MIDDCSFIKGNKKSLNKNIKKYEVKSKNHFMYAIYASPDSNTLITSSGSEAFIIKNIGTTVGNHHKVVRTKNIFSFMIIIVILSMIILCLIKKFFSDLICTHIWKGILYLFFISSYTVKLYLILKRNIS